MTWAVKRKLRPDNPVRGIEKPRDTKRLRRLSELEYGQLWQVISAANPTIASVIKMLGVTGFRSGEARFLKWSEVDLSRQMAILEDTKTGQSIRPLSKIAVEIIEAQPRNGPMCLN